VVPGGSGLSSGIFGYFGGGFLFKKEDPKAPEADGSRSGAKAKAAADENGKDAIGEPDKI
jgi:hypothetical protein